MFQRKKRGEIERELIELHMKIYGALPVGQGASGLLASSICGVDERKAKEFFR